MQGLFEKVEVPLLFVHREEDKVCNLVGLDLAARGANLVVP